MKSLPSTTYTQPPLSPSSRGRGLKYTVEPVFFFLPCVALFTRAWIEIFFRFSFNSSCSVALFTRAWIEIKSRWWYWRWCSVALFTRAWIEIRLLSVLLVSIVWSPSSRGRGLKLRLIVPVRHRDASPSSRGRGLKLLIFRYIAKCTNVALFTRAWIEISKKPSEKKNPLVALFTRAWIEIL